jgi:hypothetical protein
MYKVPPTWPVWPAVGAQLERGVRPHSLRYDFAADAGAAAGTCVDVLEEARVGLQLTDFSIQKATLPTKATLPETTAVVAKVSAPPRTWATHSWLEQASKA